MTMASSIRAGLAGNGPRPPALESFQCACALLRACLDTLAVRERFGERRNPAWAVFAADTLKFLDDHGELPAGFAERLALSWAHEEVR